MDIVSFGPSTHLDADLHQLICNLASLHTSYNITLIAWKEWECLLSLDCLKRMFQLYIPTFSMACLRGLVLKSHIDYLPMRKHKRREVRRVHDYLIKTIFYSLALQHKSLLLLVFFYWSTTVVNKLLSRKRLQLFSTNTQYIPLSVSNTFKAPG